uniref:Alternative protein PHYHIPL n=1 Tax=Homo sapiens TaxID=9606 RepID=L8E903_HUMAN|nr:alternative protein PHYHIPL [Homo sapiens]
MIYTEVDEANKYSGFFFKVSGQTISKLFILYRRMNNYSSWEMF